MNTREAADNQLRSALIAHAEAYDLTVEGELLSEFGVIAAWQPLEAVGRHRYTTHFHAPEVPAHVAVGLFTIGVQFDSSEG